MSHDILLKTSTDRYRPSLLPTADSCTHWQTNATRLPIAAKEAKKEQPAEMKEFFLGKSRKLTGRPRHKYRSPGN
jgi:hypothetical protein